MFLHMPVRTFLRNTSQGASSQGPSSLPQLGLSHDALTSSLGLGFQDSPLPPCEHHIEQLKLFGRLSLCAAFTELWKQALKTW